MMRIARPRALLPWLLLPLILFLFYFSGRNPDPGYSAIPIPDRKMNLLGLEAVSTKYLDDHPDAYLKFARILTEADDALQADQSPSRGAVIRWIEGRLKEEGLDETASVYLFLQNVYLKGWKGAYLRRIDAGEREYLYDLMGAVMGGMHRCTKCNTAPHPE